MPKKPAKVPFSNAHKIFLDFSDADWRGIEQKYETQISAQTRRKIAEVTEEYLTSAQYEIAAKSAKGAYERVAELRAQAASFLTLIEQRLTCDKSDLWADMEIGNALHKQMLPRGMFSLESEVRFLEKFIAACDEAKKTMDQESEHVQDGASWRDWIIRLTEVAKEAGLPYTVRKDSDKNKSGKPSPFTTLVKALQDGIPKVGYRPSTPDGLPAEINKARSRRKKLLSGSMPSKKPI